MASIPPGTLRLFVALIPPVEVQEFADRLIAELSDRYRTSTSKSPPHVTLQAPFVWRSAAIPELEAHLSQFAYQPVPLTLEGFGAFASRVLYINVAKTPELLTLQTRLTAHLEELGIVDRVAKRRPFVPHVTIASRHLSDQTFRQAWTDLQTQRADFQFLSDRLTLLRHEGQRWQIQSDYLM